MKVTLALFAFLALLLAGATPSLAQPGADPRYVAFDKAVEETKTAIMGDPRNALAKSDVALARAQALSPSPRAETAHATALWLKTEALIGLNRLKEAEQLIDQALAIAQRTAPNTKLHGDVLRSRGGVAGLIGNVQKALKDYLAAYQIFRAVKEVRSQAITLQDIGQIYFDAGDYPRVIRYYGQAQELYNADPGFALTTHNNLGETYRMMKRLPDAEREYDLALQKARELDSAVLQVRILNNLALVELQSGKLGEATRSANQALRLTASGEAADWRRFVYAILAEIATARGDHVQAASLLARSFAGLDLDKTELIYKEFHEVAAKVFERLGRMDQALAHLKAFQRLDSEARSLTASASSQLLSAEFDFANQNLRISQLKQGQLERDVKIERQRGQFRTTLFTGLAIAGAIVMALILAAFFSIRRSRNQVRAANVVLGETNVALEKALKAKTEFLATTSHEIRTPLNGILGMTQILLSNRKLDGEMRDQVKVVHGAGEAMRTLVDDILDVAKMETGEVTVAHEHVAFRTMLEDAARLWSGHAIGKGLALKLDIADAPACIVSDEARLRQIVNNLLSNAVKFTAEGEVSLSARADRDAGMLTIAVRDTGIGISQENHALVFEAFHQVDGGMNRQFSGTGLGLSICRNLAEALGGRIELDSQPGHGSTFTLITPLREVPHAEVNGAIRPTLLSEARVLMVEANELTQGILRNLLEGSVASLDFVLDGQAALAAIGTGTADHLVVEASSAKIDGMSPLAALGRVVAAGQADALPVTILLAPSDDLPLGDVAALGAQLVLKPVNGLQLVAALHDPYTADAAASLTSAA